MDEYLIFILHKILQILQQKQLTFSSSIENINQELETLIDEGLIDNDTIIDILSMSYNVESLHKKSFKEIKILYYHLLEEYVKNGYFIYKDEQERWGLAVNELTSIPKLCQEYANEPNIATIKIIKKEDFIFLLEYNFWRLNLVKSKYFLDFLSPLMTAKNFDYKKSLTGFLVIFSVLTYSISAVFKAINISIYLLYNILKLVLFQKTMYSLAPREMPIKYTGIFPIYTILLPLYKEERSVKLLINAIESLNYPKHKLDVKIIIEIDDHGTLNKIKNLPKYFELIIVPFGLPRTKPKALNYAMQYCRGEYVVIYDAEDRPEPDQLLKALAAFKTLPENYACLQAKLNFYNADKNLLTKFFSIEYSIWFDYLLNGLSRLDLPVPLGGTSNHFRASQLKISGLWDPYNVTEDADLGIRFYSLGFKTHILDSITLEEAPTSVNNWIYQRARWIKGYIQTFFVFTMQKNHNNELTFLQKFSITAFMGLSSYGFFCAPWVIFIMKSPLNCYYQFLWIINLYFALSYLYGIGAYVIYIKRAKISNFRFLDLAGILLLPVYFILHTIAAYRAVFECFFSPFSWNKTEHGVNLKDLEE